MTHRHRPRRKGSSDRLLELAVDRADHRIDPAIATASSRPNRPLQAVGDTVAAVRDLVGVRRVSV